MTIKRFLSLRLVPAAWVALVLLAALSLFPAAPAQADPIAVQRASLQADGSGWSLDARFDFDLNNSLEDAVNKGVPAVRSLSALRRHLAPIVREIAGVDSIGSQSWLSRKLGR